MQRAVTRESYAERIDRVLRHVAEDIDQRHSLDDLAAVACFSPFHFHRIYRGATGETVEETVRRLRMHRAAYELNATALPIERVARRVGYGSVAAFSRAFKLDHGVAPSSYRRERRHGGVGHTRKPQELTMYDVEIGKMQHVRLAGLDHKGDYNAIGTTFDRLGALAGAKGLFRPDTRMFGVYYDSPDAVPKADLRSFAGLTVAADYAGDKELRLETIAAGPVASLVHKGPYAELHKAYDFLFCDWLPKSGRDPADAPPFEEYLNNPRELPPSEWLTRVSVPLSG
ncbi:MAG: AraC family transcriptional regulator [Beijerinckiaceae bacterium]